MGDQLHEKLRYKLKLIFDADQFMDDLQFDILEEDNSIMELSGQLAGAYCMDQNYILDVEVVALNSMDNVSHIELVDLTLVCKPAIGAQQTDLSPYQSNSAGCTKSRWIVNESQNIDILDEDNSLESPSGPLQMTATTFTLADPFVLSSAGSWEIAGYLSAKLTQNVPAPGQPAGPVCRVYVFDPIVVVRGGGGTP